MQNMIVSHQLEIITFTTRGLPGCDIKNLGWHSNWSLDPQFLVLGTSNQISTNCSKNIQTILLHLLNDSCTYDLTNAKKKKKAVTFLEILNILRRKSDPNLVNLFLRLFQPWLGRFHPCVCHLLASVNIIIINNSFQLIITPVTFMSNLVSTVYHTYKTNSIKLKISILTAIKSLSNQSSCLI